MLLYEYPFNESMRTMLRLERLFDRLGELVARDSSLDHHVAIATLFEIVEVASRSDLKSDLMKDLDRQRNHWNGWRSNPAVDGATLDALIARIDAAFNALNTQTQKPGYALLQHEWLAAVRSRLAIPGGTFEFDLPAYHAWLHRDAAERRSDLLGWAGTLGPLAEALRVLMQLVRETGQPARVVSTGGVYQQTLPPNRVVNLLRLRVDPALELVPEISGHRLMVSVRWLSLGEQGRGRPAKVDAPFELTLCH